MASKVKEGTPLWTACDRIVQLLSSVEQLDWEHNIFHKRELQLGYKFLNDVGWWIDEDGYWPGWLPKEIV